MRRFESMFPKFSLRLTRWGGGFLLGLVLVGGAAVNTGNNALVGVVSVALASYLVAGVWSREMLRHVCVEVVPPREAFAEREVQLTVRLRNRSRLLPAYGVVLRDVDGELVLRQVYLPRRGSVDVAVWTTFAHRGWCAVGPWRLEVALPLAFFVKSKEAVPAQRVLVYPALGPVVQPPWLTNGVQSGSPAKERRGREGEVLQLRFFQDGDEAQQVHWKQTARQQRLIVVDRQAPEQAAPVLVIDSQQQGSSVENRQKRFERLLSEATSIIVHRLARGLPIGLIIDDQVFPPVVGRGQRRQLLRLLAELELSSGVKERTEGAA